MKFQSTKIIDGFSTCFRQWKAEGTHCKYLHGYAISFEVIFEGELDERNWVVDFGFLSRYTVAQEELTGEMSLKQFFAYMFDHTTVIAQDDPELRAFEALAANGIIQLRVMPRVGCEMFAKFVFDILQAYITEKLEGRVRVISVRCFEHNKNSAIYAE